LSARIWAKYVTSLTSPRSKARRQRAAPGRAGRPRHRYAVQAAEVVRDRSCAAIRELILKRCPARQTAGDGLQIALFVSVVSPPFISPSSVSSEILNETLRTSDPARILRIGAVAPVWRVSCDS
jgi:hypothetical protein